MRVAAHLEPSEPQIYGNASRRITDAFRKLGGGRVAQTTLPERHLQCFGVSTRPRPCYSTLSETALIRASESSISPRFLLKRSSRLVSARSPAGTVRSRCSCCYKQGSTRLFTVEASAVQLDSATRALGNRHSAFSRISSFCWSSEAFREAYRKKK